MKERAAGVGWDLPNRAGRPPNKGPKAYTATLPQSLREVITVSAIFTSIFHPPSRDTSLAKIATGNQGVKRA